MTDKPRSQEPLQPPKDSDPSEMTDFEKNTTTEELAQVQDEPVPVPATHRTPGSAEGEREPGDQSR